MQGKQIHREAKCNIKYMSHAKMLFPPNLWSISIINIAVTLFHFFGISDRVSIGNLEYIYIHYFGELNLSTTPPPSFGGLHFFHDTQRLLQLVYKSI